MTARSVDDDGARVLIVTADRPDLGLCANDRVIVKTEGVWFVTVCRELESIALAGALEAGILTEVEGQPGGMVLAQKLTAHHRPPRSQRGKRPHLELVR